MKLPAKKPISSPGRSDKFPPPLMRFLRSNAGSKSRGRLRSSPMFVRKKNTTAAVETQEPSSPKVTCMGQVRVRRASSSSSSSAASSRPGRARRAGAPTRRKRCGWIQHAVFCSDFPGKLKPKSCRDLWRKWVPFFQAGFCSRARVEEETPKIEARFGEGVRGFCSDDEEQEEEHEEQEYERKAKAFAFAASSCSPPKNALLLTRCRSAPYRSSSLACRFWGSPNRGEEETGEEEQEQSKTGEEEQEQEQSIGNERPSSERESISDQESRTEQVNEEKIEFFKGLENSIRERMAESASIEDSKEGEFGSESARPLILTRCKSEPARTAAEKLDPDSVIHSHQVFVIN